MTSSRLVLGLTVAVLAPVVLIGAARPAPGDPGPPPAADAGWSAPSMPPPCTDEELAAGEVATCLVSPRGAPPRLGWGAPPFPSPDPQTPDAWPPDGWSWLGWGYNGSPALTDWESHQAATTRDLGAIGAGRLTMHADALALFEGFLAEVAAGGYDVREYGGYVFRCTSGTGKTCRGRTPSSLSLHAWGLAVDLNPSTNPERIYRASEGASACAQPMVTDVPAWVVAAAERWGLYWGGYGWGRACATPDGQARSVHRDPHHFEFRGTPELAHRIVEQNTQRCAHLTAPPVDAAWQPAAPGGFTSLGPNRLADTRDGTGGTLGMIPAGCTLVLDVAGHAGVPGDATAAALAVTATDVTEPGSVTVWPCAAERPMASTSYPWPGEATTNLALAALGPGGRVCLSPSVDAHVAVAVTGWWGPGGGTGLVATTPVRLADTRDGTGVGKGRVPRDAVLEIDLAAPVAADRGASGAALEVTVVAADGPGTLSVWPCEQPRPAAPSGTFAGPAAVTTTALVALDGSGRVCVSPSIGADVVVDLAGWTVPAAAGSLVMLPVARLADTRDGTAVGKGRVVRDGVLELPVAGHGGVPEQGATTVALQVTIVGASSPGYVTVWPCDEQRPVASNVNVPDGRAIADLTIARLDGSGRACLFSSASAHVVVDVIGYWTAPPAA